jgi:hypothetical protein
MAKRGIIARRWCFTHPRSDPEAEAGITKLQNDDNVVCLICEEETGKDGYEHYQGYIEWKHEKSFNYLTTCPPISQKTHWEKAEGSKQKHIQYCSKESRVRWIKGCEIKKEEKSKHDDEYCRSLMQDCEKLELNELIEKRPKEWFLHREKIERFMIESLGRRARVWNGHLQ